MDKQIELSLSVDYYLNKPKNIAQIRYHRHTLTQKSLMIVLKSGYCVAHCFRTQNDVFTQSEKTNENFEYTQMIGIDIDDCDTDMETFIKRLKRKPTFAYTTFSNGIKGNRFRMIYLFNQKIDSIPLYKTVYNWITEGLNINDNCMRSVSQQMFGTNFAAKWYNSDIWYDVPHFDESIITNQSIISKSVKSKYPNIPNTNNIERERVHISCDDTCGHLLSDLNKMIPFDFLMKYRDKYPYFCASPLHYENGYATIDENYFEIRRKWHKDVYETPNGEKTIISVAKLHDGNMRRIRLRTVAKIIRNIMPDITFEHLLYILVYERTYYYDNSDKTLTNRKLISIAKQVIEAPFETIKMIGDDKRKFKVDKAYWREQGITPRQAVQIIRKGKKYEEIGSMYDFNLTDTENIKVMKDNGLSISINTLKRWRKENNIDKKEKQMKQDVIKDYYNSQLTDEQNIKLMNENGVKVSINTLRRWRKQNGITREIGGDHCSQSYKQSEEIKVSKIIKKEIWI